MDQEALRRLILAKLRAGRLPRVSSTSPRTVFVLSGVILFAACSPPPPAWTLWRIQETWAPKALTTITPPVERQSDLVRKDLDQVTCELTLQRHAFAVQQDLQRLKEGAARADGVIYTLNETKRGVRFLCVRADRKPPPNLKADANHD